MITFRRLTAPLALAVISSSLLFAGPVASADAASAPGPALSVTTAQMQKALHCSGPLTGLHRDPVLLTPAFSTADQSYSFNYERQLPAVGITTCTLTLPDHGYGDLQVTAQYDVLAIRKMSAASGRKIALVGHQHGALDELWAMTYWPDIAGKVSDLVSFETPYQGTDLGPVLCSLRACPPSAWQISTGSKFLTALNATIARRGLSAGPSYTSIASTYDELIVPQPRSSTLPGAKNIQVQDICPLRPVGHFTSLADNVIYELVLDALGHRGPANPACLPANICTGPLFMPGVTSAQGGALVASDAIGAATGALYGIAAYATPAEPAVRSYASK